MTRDELITALHKDKRLDFHRAKRQANAAEKEYYSEAGNKNRIRANSIFHS